MSPPSPSPERARELLEQLLDQLSGVYYRCLADQARTILEVSKNLQEMTRYPAAAFLERRLDFELLIDPRDRADVRRVVREGLDKKSSFQVVYRVLGPDQTPCWFWEQGRQAGETPEGIPILEGYIMDMSRIHHLEAIDMASRLETLGLMCNGVAHDTNNMLSVVTGNLELLDMMSEALPEDAHEALDDARDALGRVRAMMRQLQRVSQDNTEPLSRSPVDALILSFKGSLERLLRQGHTLTLSLDAPQSRARIPIGRLEVALLNLTLNALEAMPQGGSVHIATRRVGPSEPGARLPVDAVVVEVRDEGEGIAPEVRPKIFEPGFTTRAQGHGQGLSDVHRAVREIDGALHVDSAPGRGARVEMHLPLVGALPPQGLATTSEASAPGPQLLLIESNHIIRPVAAEALRARGFQVTAYSSARRALDALDHEELSSVEVYIPGLLPPFDLDPDLVKRLRQSFPEACHIQLPPAALGILPTS